MPKVMSFKDQMEFQYDKNAWMNVRRVFKNINGMLKINFKKQTVDMWSEENPETRLLVFGGLARRICEVAQKADIQICSLEQMRMMLKNAYPDIE